MCELFALNCLLNDLIVEMIPAASAIYLIYYCNECNVPCFVVVRDMNVSLN